MKTRPKPPKILWQPTITSCVRSRALLCLKLRGALTLRAIAAYTGDPVGSVQKRLSELVADGKVERVKRGFFKRV